MNNCNANGRLEAAVMFYQLIWTALQNILVDYNRETPHDRTNNRHHLLQNLLEGLIQEYHDITQLNRDGLVEVEITATQVGFDRESLTISLNADGLNPSPTNPQINHFGYRTLCNGVNVRNGHCFVENYRIPCTRQIGDEQILYRIIVEEYQAVRHVNGINKVFNIRIRRTYLRNLPRE